MVSDVAYLTDTTIPDSSEKGALSSYLETLNEIESAILLPDMTYPDHPSTGMVTDPEVVSILISGLIKHTAAEPADVEIFCATSGELSPETTASLLGYESVAADLGINLGYATEGSSLTKLIDDHPVITVLSPRFSMRNQEPITHNSFFAELAQEGADVSGHGVDVRGSVLDAKYLHCGHSFKADRILVSQDYSSIDGAVSMLLGNDGTTKFDDGELKRIGSKLDVEAPSTSRIGDRAMEMGYRVYSKMSGDVIPPQMEN